MPSNSLANTTNGIAFKLSQNVEFTGTLLDEGHGHAVALPKCAKFATNPLNKGTVENPVNTRQFVLDSGLPRNTAWVLVRIYSMILSAILRFWAQAQTVYDTHRVAPL